MAPYDEVKQYNVYAVKDGKEVYLGGTYDEVFYINDVNKAIAEAEKTTVESVTVSPKEVNAVAGDTVDFDAKVDGIKEEDGQITIVLKAVSADGTESEGAATSHNYKDSVQNVEVKAEDGKLNVTWEGGKADVVVTTEYEKEARVWTASGENGCTVDVASGAEADGARYTMTITTPEGAAVTYDGQLDDSYCAPFDGKISGGYIDFPKVKDWWKMTYSTVTDGVESEETTATRFITIDQDKMPSIPKDADTVKITLSDYRGNVSETVEVKNSPSVIITTDVSSVQADTQVQFEATVKNYAESDAVVWSVSGNNSADTKIDANGLLTVASDETAASVTVTGTYKSNTNLTRNVTITVKQPVAGVVSLSKSSIVKSSGIQTDTGNTWEDVEYMLDGDLATKATAEGQNVSAGSTPNSYVIVDIGEANAQKGIVALDAYAALDQATPSNRFGAKTVKLSYSDTADGTYTEAATVELEAQEGYWDNESAYPNRVTFETPIKARYFKYEVVEWYSGWGAIWDFTLYTSVDTKAAPAPTNAEPVVSQEVMWTVEGANSADTKVDENGTLTIGIDETAEQLYVTATSVADETKSDTAVVNVTPKEKFYVEVIAGEHGTVTPGSGEYYEGTDVTFTFTPDEGYVVDQVTVDGEAVTLTDGKYTLTVTGTTQIEASFKANTKAPDTGDYTPILIPVIFTLAAVLLAGGVYLFVSRGKRKSEK